MSLEFRGEVQAGDINVGVISNRLFFKAVRLSEITTEVNGGKREEV